MNKNLTRKQSLCKYTQMKIEGKLKKFPVTNGFYFFIFFELSVPRKRNTEINPNSEIKRCFSNSSRISNEKQERVRLSCFLSIF